MITILQIEQRNGYSGYDHLLGDLTSMVGSNYRSMRDLRAAVWREQKAVNDRRCATPPVRTEIICRGERVEVEV